MFYYCFTTVLQGLLDALLPLRRIRVKQHVNPWATTSSIRAARHLRDELYCRQALFSGAAEDWRQFRCAHNKVNYHLKSAKL